MRLVDVNLFYSILIYTSNFCFAFGLMSLSYWYRTVLNCLSGAYLRFFLGTFCQKNENELFKKFITYMMIALPQHILPIYNRPGGRIMLYYYNSIMLVGGRCFRTIEMNSLFSSEQTKYNCMQG